MKIEIEIPGWAEERAIYVFAGVELAATKVPGGKWQVKTGRCNMCGKCCTNLKKHVFPLIDGQCIYLQKEPGQNDEWLCGLGILRPFGCCIGSPSKVPECTEEFEVIK